VGQGALRQRLGVPALHDLPAVGENRHDHLRTRMNYEVRDPNKLVLDDFRGVSVGTFALRLRSRGHVRIASRDAAQFMLEAARDDWACRECA
jgi:choline dehydrogenase-like flavoprotein